MQVFRLILALALGASAARAQFVVRPLLAPVPAVPAALSPSVLPVAALPALAAPSALTLAPALVPVPAAPAAGAPELLTAGQFHPALIPPAAADRELEAGFYAKLFDGVAASGVDGAQVYPRLLTAPNEKPLGLPLQLSIVRAAVEKSLPALRESVALGSWNGPHTTLDESCCGDAAPKLAALLRARGIPARLVEAEFHYYVLLDLPGGQIVADPTVRQFFGKKGAPRGVPAVFVGTIGELEQLFTNFAAAKTTRYAPGRIYFSEARVREDRLSEVAADIQRGGPRDLEPLRRELGLPPAAPANPARPRLIIP